MIRNIRNFLSKYHEQILDPHLVETLPVLLKGGNLLHIPTNTRWTQSVAGSGTTVQEIQRIATWTGTTASSSALLRCDLGGFVLASSFWLLDWDKKIYLVFNYVREALDTEAVARFQIKETNTEGALGAKGIGIRSDNFALMGESYGTALGVVNLATTIPVGQSYQIVIIHYPASKIEWYVNGILKGTQPTSANIPSGKAGGVSCVVNSIINGVTGGVNVGSSIFQPKIWQEM